MIGKWLRCCKKSFQNPNPSFWVPDVRYQCYELSDQICLLSLICLYYKLYSTYMYFIHRLLSNNKEREMEGWLLSQSEHWFLWNISIIDSNFLYKNTRLCTHSNLKILLFFFVLKHPDHCFTLPSPAMLSKELKHVSLFSHQLNIIMHKYYSRRLVVWKESIFLKITQLAIFWGPIYCI